MTTTSNDTELCAAGKPSSLFYHYYFMVLFCSVKQLSPLLTLCSLLQNPNDISYVYSGYAPLSVRLAQLLARPGWRSIEEVLKMLPGPHFEERQQLPTGLQKKRKFCFGCPFFKGRSMSVWLEWSKLKSGLAESRHLSHLPVPLQYLVSQTYFGQIAFWPL